MESFGSADAASSQLQGSKRKKFKSLHVVRGPNGAAGSPAPRGGKATHQRPSAVVRPFAFPERGSEAERTNHAAHAGREALQPVRFLERRRKKRALSPSSSVPPLPVPAGTSFEDLNLDELDPPAEVAGHPLLPSYLHSELLLALPGHTSPDNPEEENELAGAHLRGRLRSVLLPAPVPRTRTMHAAELQTLLFPEVALPQKPSSSSWEPFKGSPDPVQEVRSARDCGQKQRSQARAYQRLLSNESLLKEKVLSLMSDMDIRCRRCPLKHRALEPGERPARSSRCPGD